MFDGRRFLMVVVLGLSVFATKPEGRCAETDEPVVDGVPLTKLLEQASLSLIPRAPTRGKRDEGWTPDPTAENAVRNLGTNALPYLVHLVQDDAIGRSKLALTAFRLLGSKATPAIPALEQVGMTSERTDTVSGVLQALHYIGKDALPALERLSTNPVCRVGAVAAIMELGKAGANIQPVFGEVIKPGDASAEMAVLGLRHYQATAALPLLTNVLTSSQPKMRKTALEVIRQFNGQSRPILPALIDRLYDPDKDVRDSAVYVLSQVAPEMFVTNSAPARVK